MSESIQGSLTPQRVAGALKRNGFDSSRKSTTGVRGWYNYSEGFRTGINHHDTTGQSIIVTYHSGGHHHRVNLEIAQTIKMYDVLVKEGFDVVRVDEGRNQSLIVKLKPTT